MFRTYSVSNFGITRTMYTLNLGRIQGIQITYMAGDGLKLAYFEGREYWGV